MIFYVHPDLYNNKENYQSLDDLVRLVQQQRHEWLIPDIADLDKIESWLDGMRETLGTAFMSLISRMEKEYSKNLAYKPRNPNVVVIEKGGDKYTKEEYPLNDALIYLQETVYILLEGNSDEFFLETLFNNFTNKSKEIFRAKNKRWLEYLSAGGKNNIPPTIDNRLKRFNAEKLDNKKYIRLFVLLDSDATNINRDLPASQNEILQKCKENDIEYHILYKREIENYLPETVLSNVPEEVQHVCKAYCGLGNDQKDFYDLEKGFDNKSQPHENQKNLFGQLSQATVDLLRNGFRHTKFIPKQDFHLFFAHPSINRANLLARCAHQPKPYNNELQDIIDKIAKLL